MKYLHIIFLLISVLPLTGCGESDKPKLIMVTNAEFPPYEYICQQHIDGIDPAIIRNITEKLGYELEIQNMNFDSVIAAVQSGKADIAASGLTITEERKQQVLFTIPYIVTEQLIIVRRDSTVKTPADLLKVKIGVQHGTTGDTFVAKNIKAPERYHSGPLAVAALKAGKVDAVVIDGEPAHIFVKQHPELMLLPAPLTYEEYAFAVNKNNPELLKKFNLELQKLKHSGELDKIVSHYRNINTANAAANAVSSGEPGFFRQLKQSVHINLVKDKRYRYLLSGLWNTLKITFFSLLLGIIIGFGVAIIRSMSDQTGKLKFANMLCKAYLTVIRGTPVVVQLLIIYFVIFGSIDVDKVLVAIIAFGFNSGAYVAEIIRGGIMSIDKGQMEAGRSLGLSYNQTMSSVILPQAFKNVLPALGNEFIVLLKETSISGYIALQDLTKGGDIIRSQTYDAFLPLITVALIYLALVMLFTWLLGGLEKRLKRNE